MIVGAKTVGQGHANGLVKSIGQSIRFRALAFLAFFFLTIGPGNSLLPAVQQNSTRNPAWRLHETDCGNVSSSLVSGTARSPVDSQTATMIRFNSSGGSRVVVAYPVSPVHVIRELDVEIDLMVDNPGARLMLRVALPSSVDDRNPVTTWIEGPVLNVAGRWSRLRFSDTGEDLETLIRRQIWVLRGRIARGVHQRLAYIDAVGVNLYGGPGKQSALLGRPMLVGSIPALHAASLPLAEITPPVVDEMVQPAGFLTPLAAETEPGNPDQEPLVRRSGTVIELMGQPFFPRIIQHNGEPFAMLREIGFNVAHLAAAPTEQQLAEANESGMWLIAPPPPSLGLLPIDSRYDRVIAWSVGQSRTAADIPFGLSAREKLAEHDPWKERPIVAHVESGFSVWGRVCDVEIVGCSQLLAGVPATYHYEWLNGVRLAAGDRIPLWIDVASEQPVELVRQAGAMARQVPPMPVDVESMESMAFSGIAAGARGIRILSRSRLDGNDPQTRLRALSLTWLNQRINVAQPWAASGIILGHIDPTPRLRVAALKTREGQLMIAMSHDRSLPAPGSVPVQPVTIPDRWSSISDQAMQVTDQGLVPLGATYGVAGSEIQIDQSPWLTLIVSTRDPALRELLNQLWDSTEVRRKIELRREIVSQWLVIQQLIDEQLVADGRRYTDASSAIAAAAIEIQQNADNAINSSNPGMASMALDQAAWQLAFARARWIAAAREPFAELTSLPLAMSPSLVPNHWQLASSLAGKSWQPNGLAGGDFENLQHMIDRGWENWQVDDDRLQTSVKLTPEDRYGGQHSLKLTASHQDSTSVVAEAPPLTIRSSPVFVPANSLIRIQGWVKIPPFSAGERPGLMIHDSLGGPVMGVVVNVTDGWQEFTMYRSSGEDVDLRLTLELTGYGTALVDQITIQTIPLPPPQFRSATGSTANRK